MIRIQPQGTPDHLHNIDHRTARIREKHSVTLGYIDSLSENTNRGKNTQFCTHIPAFEFGPSEKVRGEFIEHLTAVPGSMLAVQPVRLSIFCVVAT